MILKLGDCLQMMSAIPDGSVDMVMCDLPYGTTSCSWDSVVPFEPLWREYARVCAPNSAIVLTASQPFTSVLVCSNLSNFKHEWIWRKNRASNFLNAKRQPMKVHESVLVFCYGTLKYFPQITNGHPPVNFARRKANSSPVYNFHREAINNAGATTRYPKSVLDIKSVDNISKNRTHPNQKPVALMEYFIRTYTNEGDMVLDNCMGSGTTGVACLNTKRKFIGIERDEAYFKIAQDRILEAELSA